MGIYKSLTTSFNFLYFARFNFDLKYRHCLGLQDAFCKNDHFFEVKKHYFSTSIAIFSHLRKMRLGQFSYENIDPLSIDFSKKWRFSDYMHPSPISVPINTIFCQNLPIHCNREILKNLFFFGLKFKFEFWAFFRAFIRCS